MIENDPSVVSDLESSYVDDLHVSCGYEEGPEVLVQRVLDAE
jgi:hypothetical protein